MTKICLTLLLIPAAICAQDASKSLMVGSKGVYAVIRGNVLKAAQEMPEENYSFKPTADVRSFGQIVAHVADAQYEFCSPVLGDGTKSPDVEKNKTSKADIVQALQDSYAYCDKAYAALGTDQQGTQMIKFFGREMPKLTALDLNTAHTDEHYGNLVTYLRIKGLTPPSSQR
jgi:uncharacterized damage-inducible protein DinB